MGNLIHNVEFGDAVRKWLKPGDEVALARLQAALIESAEKIKGAPGGFLTAAFVSGVVETAAEMVEDATTILAATPKVKNPK